MDVKASKHLKIRNVTVLQKGQRQQGTLRLEAYHLTFSYVPAQRVELSAERSAHNVASSPEAGENKTESAEVTQDSKPAASARGSSESTFKHRTPDHKPREKTIWIPYPLINSCMLSPSHSQSNIAQERNNHLDDRGSAGGYFPPVYGTSPYTRPSTDLARLAPYSSPQRSVSPSPNNANTGFSNARSRETRLRIRCRDFKMLAFLFYDDAQSSADDTAREVFYALRDRCCVERVQDLHAFHFKAPQEETAVGEIAYEARREFARMGIGSKAVEGPGSAWRITEINADYSFSPTYPKVLCVPHSVSDNMLKYGGPFRSKARIPALTYLHSNGGSISRCSQPMPGVTGKRNPQDERLVSAIFTSHTGSHQSPTGSPPRLSKDVPESSPDVDASNTGRLERETSGLPLSKSETALDDTFIEHESLPRPKVYGSTRRNMIVDARPKINAMANRAGGGGMEDVANYRASDGSLPERIFLDIPNIHVMRKSLEKVVESFVTSDFTDLRPDQEALRKSGWLRYIAGLLDGANMVARAVGLGGSHVLLHCSDGWDRTSQVAAIAEVMLDPYYRTLQGFVTLVQKDFLSFGHKFEHRNGTLGSEKWFDIENERVVPSRSKENSSTDPKGMNTFGSKAISGAKNWFEKSRGSIFGQANDSRSSLDGSGSRPPSPPANPVLHAPASTSTAKDREHKIKEDEIAPIFHQFLDAIFQLQHQHPNAFEFNERFLVRLFYQTYASQYGEFLFNNERDRSANEGRFASVWPHFFSRRREFINPDYVAKIDDPLLFPGQSVEIRWWSNLFGRKDEEMNTPRSLAPPDADAYPASFAAQPSELSLPSDDSTADERPNDAKIKETRRVPSFDTMRNTITSAFNSFQPPKGEQRVPESSSSASRPVLKQRETDIEVLAHYAGASKAADTREVSQSSAAGPTQMEMHDDDPLAVQRAQDAESSSSSRLDPAAFAQSSAYRD
ncbi:hypothetical protein AC579_3702 [Pseudocercospora musae]|uniref:Myotubularin phosphatase domain-containing protein n=1 Tax=Pseudocercospora musae TaxID=113226 RepID=A0A139IIS5_9PEZI|nr:hypothetical protein AC579_3702 [Pseudocercospora musae]